MSLSLKILYFLCTASFSSPEPLILIVDTERIVWHWKGLQHRHGSGGDWGWGWWWRSTHANLNPIFHALNSYLGHTPTEIPTQPPNHLPQLRLDYLCVLRPFPIWLMMGHHMSSAGDGHLPIARAQTCEQHGCPAGYSLPQWHKASLHESARRTHMAEFLPLLLSLW
jgi:hypothetical protein